MRPPALSCEICPPMCTCYYKEPFHGERMGLPLQLQIWPVVSCIPLNSAAKTMRTNGNQCEDITTNPSSKLLRLPMDSPRCVVQIQPTIAASQTAKTILDGLGRSEPSRKGVKFKIQALLHWWQHLP